MKTKQRIVIGLPMYQDVSPENKIDAMRMMFFFGRHMSDYDFSLSWRAKAEQFRARNFIVNKAREFDADYLLFMDDDHIVDWQDRPGNKSYDFLDKLIKHMEEDEGLGIVGCLYYQRGGGMYKPVLMHDTGTHGIFYDDHEILGQLQEVDIQGGGVMLLRMKMFDKIPEPYFKPETLDGEDRQGTDLQICRLARKYGWKVACDTGIVIGHEHSNRTVVSPNNRHLFIEDAHRRGVDNIENELLEWQKKVMLDIMSYLQIGEREVLERGASEFYEFQHRVRFHTFKNPDDYYRSIGNDQICRQVVHHTTPWVAARDSSLVNMIRSPKQMTGLDFGCGIGIIGFEALRMDNYVDFVDVEGSAAFDFLQWRVGRYGFGDRTRFSLAGPYDFVLALDVIEHFEDWEYVLDNIVGRMNPGSAFITNFFTDELREDDPEHFHLDRKGVADFLMDRGFLPSHMGLWIKRDNFLGGPKNVRNFRKKNDRGGSPAIGQA